MTLTFLKRAKTEVGPESNGILMTPRKFDRADFDECWRYELINGVLIVSPIASVQAADQNDELNYWLRKYRDNHPNGSCLKLTLCYRIVQLGSNRRLPDRVIWAGTGQKPREHAPPAITVEFVSSQKRDRERDYKTKRVEYLDAGVKEYWVIDRFDRCMVVFTRRGGKDKHRVIKENEIYTTPLLDGFELHLGKLLATASRWPGHAEPEENEEGES